MLETIAIVVLSWLLLTAAVLIVLLVKHIFWLDKKSAIFYDTLSWSINEAEKAGYSDLAWKMCSRVTAELSKQIDITDLELPKWKSTPKGPNTQKSS